MRFRVALLALLLCRLGVAGPYADLSHKLEHASPAQTERLARQSELFQDDDNIGNILDTPNQKPDAKATAVRDYVAMRALFERQGSPTEKTPITGIKQSNLYRRAADTGGDNWVARALKRIRIPNMRLPSPSMGPIALPAMGALVYIMWGLLALAVAAFLFFAIRYFVLQTERRRGVRSKALLEDDEPERTLDEWLELADRLEQEGRHREAIRCLYVACLLRYDEHRVARFDRTQTNWEHYRRISESAANPREFDLLTPTRDFDHVWYGYRPTGPDEVRRFRDWYQTLTSLLAKGAVAMR